MLRTLALYVAQFAARMASRNSPVVYLVTRYPSPQRAELCLRKSGSSAECVCRHQCRGADFDADELGLDPEEPYDARYHDSPGKHRKRDSRAPVLRNGSELAFPPLPVAAGALHDPGETRRRSWRDAAPDHDRHD